MADENTNEKMNNENEKKPFVHLHVHTEYSLLDGAARLTRGKKTPLVDTLIKKNMPAVAITDHGNMYGAYTLYKQCKNKGIKPIIGCEFYTCSNMRERTGRNGEFNHLVLLAKNDIGYKNLVKLDSLAFTEGFYYKPRIDIEFLKEHSEGLICLSACLAGKIPQYILNNEYEKAKEYALMLKGMFDEGDFYIEIQNHGIADEIKVLPYLVKLAREIGVKLVATNDCHYLEKKDAEMHDVLLCVQTGKTYDDPNRMRFEGNEFYLKDYDEMYELFKDYPESLETPFEIMDKCNVTIKKEDLMPPYEPDDKSKPADYLRKIAFEGLEKRYGTITKEIEERAEYELNIIIRMGFAEYYLIVWDFIDFARRNDIPVGKGRGSGVGSIIAYAIGITDVEPLRYSLLFERFLNPERVSNPDFDIDFCQEGRGKVKEYVVDRYGKDKVCEIITFGTMACKAAIKDVARVYNIPFETVNKITKLIPGGKISVDGVLGQGKPEEKVPELIEMYEENEEIRKVLDMARAVEGMPRQTGKHAAGVVICKEIISDFVPLQKNGEDITTQFQKDEVEELGMLKMDFLGLTTLTDVKKAKQYIKETTGRVIDFQELGYEDEEVFKLLGTGETDAVFQLESAGMKKFMKELQPKSLEDIIAGISLYRPGPMDSIPKYIQSKNNPETISYAHPMLEPILNVTYGCIVYQEQVMQIVRELGGYTYGRADLLRRAMSKKKLDVMLAEKDTFLHGCEYTPAKLDPANGQILKPEVKAVDGCIKRGVSEEIGSAIFDEMESFASYAFNKSHAAAYGVLAYETAFFKRYYPVQFITAVINDRITKADEVAKYVQYLRDTGYKVLPPDVNRSFAEFRCEIDDSGEVCVRFGLSGIKNVGESAITLAVNEREEKGPYKSLDNFLKRTAKFAFNRKLLESLILGGAFDSLGDNRATCMGSYEKLVSLHSKDSKMQALGQMSIFELMDDDGSADEKLVPIEEYDTQKLLSMEKEVLNVYMSGHPLGSYSDEIRSMEFNLSQIKDLLVEDSGDEDENGTDDIERRELAKQFDRKKVTLGCMIQSFKRSVTKSGKTMGFGRVEDIYASIDIVLFPAVFERHKELLEKDNIILIEGTLEIGDRTQINVQSLRSWSSSEDDKEKVKEQPKKTETNPASRLYVNFSELSDDEIGGVLRTLESYRGDCPAYGQRNGKLLDTNIKVAVTNQLIWELSAIVGEKNVKYVEKK